MIGKTETATELKPVTYALTRRCNLAKGTAAADIHSTLEGNYMLYASLTQCFSHWLTLANQQKAQHLQIFTARWSGIMCYITLDLPDETTMVCLHSASVHRR